LRVTLDRRRHRVDIALDQVVRDDVSELVKPEFGECSQHFTFTLDRSRQYAIKSGDAISRDDEKTIIVDVVYVSHFATAM
jgi:hypothetical protein